MIKKLFYVLFVIFSIAAILEYLFICGTFTGPLAMLLVLVAGVANIILSAKNREGSIALLFLIATIGLCMGYWKLMF
ncbi:MAG: hypothetical protein LUE92_12445 [Clostridiales bacterium]|nr:hypothetical protein [Clostridiales bacterium]